MHGMALLRSKRGTLAKIARALGVTPSAVAQWKRLPAERVVAISAATGIPKHELRPDLFDAPPASPPAPPAAEVAA